jgi:ankyrin repeat protein
MRRPIHYAAACSGTGPLNLLIEKGANLADVDMKKVTCLHTAVRAGRPDNVKIILSKNNAIINLRDR